MVINSTYQNPIEPPKMPPLVPRKLQIFNFGLKQKLDHYSGVEFHGDSHGNGFKPQKPIIDPLIDLSGIFKLAYDIDDKCFSPKSKICIFGSTKGAFWGFSSRLGF